MRDCRLAAVTKQIAEAIPIDIAGGKKILADHAFAADPTA